MQRVEIDGMKIIKKPIPSYPGYYADVLGNIYSVRSGKEIVISQRIHKDYLHVTVRDTNSPVKIHKEPVHKLVLQAFRGYRPDNYVCRHLNGNCLDNRLVNLKWGTQKENMLDSIKHGTAAFLRHGENANGSKLKLKQVFQIRWLYKFGYKQKELAAWFDISQKHVSDITRGRTWEKDIC